MSRQTRLSTKPGSAPEIAVAKTPNRTSEIKSPVGNNRHNSDCLTGITTERGYGVDQLPRSPPFREAAVDDLHRVRQRRVRLLYARPGGTAAPPRRKKVPRVYPELLEPLLGDLTDRFAGLACPRFTTCRRPLHVKVHRHPPRASLLSSVVPILTVSYHQVRTDHRGSLGGLEIYLSSDALL
jgi:hypothetical protein